MRNGFEIHKRQVLRKIHRAENGSKLEYGSAALTGIFLEGRFVLGNDDVRGCLVKFVQRFPIDCPDGESQEELDNSVLVDRETWEKLFY